MREKVKQIVILGLILLAFAMMAGCGGHKSSSFLAKRNSPAPKPADKPKAGGITSVSALKTTSGAPTGVRVTWARETATNIAGYYIYRDTSSIPDSAVGNATHRVNGGNLFPQPSSGAFVTFDDTFPAVIEQTYYYRLTAADTDGDESNFSNEMSITIASFSIGSFSPTSGHYGTTVDIYGLHFGVQDMANDKVEFSGVVDNKAPSSLTPGKALATITSWTDTHIQVTVPVGAVTGPITVTCGGSSLDTATNFTIVSPYISQITPDHGKVGGVVTLDGANFGATRGTSSVTFNATVPNTSDYVSWTSTQIQVKAPAGGSNGPVVVHVGSETSNAVYFSYDPAITLVTPQRRIAGDMVTIAGTHFGSEAAGHVVFNGVTVPSASTESWSDTSIDLSLPTGAKPIGAVIVNDGTSDSLPYLYQVGIVSNGTVNPPIGIWGMNLGNPNEVAIDGSGATVDLTIDQSSHTYKFLTEMPTGWTVEPFAPGVSASGYPSLTYDPSNVPPALYATYLDGNTSSQKLAVNNGSGWAYEDVPPPASDSGFAGAYSSVYVGAASTEINVAYQFYSYTTYSYVLVYAHRPVSGGSWTTETADSTQNSGAWCRIVIAPNGTPMIAYQCGSQLRFAEKSGSSWTVTTIAGGGTTYSGDYTSLGVDASNVPYIVYRQEMPGVEGIECSYRSGASWTTEEIQSAGGGDHMLYPSMQLDSTGEPRVTFTYQESLFGTYTQKAGYRYIVTPPPGPMGTPPPFPTWETELNQLTNIGQYNGLALGPGNVMHICSYSEDTTDVEYTTFNGNPPPPPATGTPTPGVWTNADVADLVLLGGTRFGDHSLCYDSQGYARTIGVTTHVDGSQELSYYYETAGGWQREVLAGPFGSVQHVALALDENDDPHVALYDAGGVGLSTVGEGGSVYYGTKSSGSGTKDGGNWTWQSVHSGMPAGPIGIALGALSTQQVRMAVNDVSSSTLLCFISDDGGATWDTQTVCSGGTSNSACSLALDYATSLPIVATAPTLGTLAPPTVYYYRGGGIWSSSTVDTGQASLVSLWMMSTNVPAVAYLNFTGGNYWLYFASYDPSKSAWSKTQLEYLNGTPQGLSLDVYNDSNMTDQPVIAVQPEDPSYWGVNLWSLYYGSWQQGNVGLGPYEGYSTAVKGMTNGQVGLVFDDQAQLHGYTRGPIAYWRDIPNGGE